MKPDTPRVLVRVFHRNRWRTSNGRPVCPIPTRETGAYGETNLTVALRGFLCSRENRSALATALMSSSSRARAHVAWPVYSRNETGVQKKCHLEDIFLSGFWFREIDLFMRFFEHQTKHIEVSSSKSSYYFWRSCAASLCLLCCFETEGPACCDGGTSTPGLRDPAALCVLAQGAAFFGGGGGKSRSAFSGGGGARLAHTKQARRATRTAGAASCVAALVGLGRAAFRRSFSSLIAHRGPICVVLITAHSGPDSRAACYVACCALPSRPVAVSGFIGFYRALSGFIRFYPVLSGFGGFYRALVGFRGLSWVWVGFSASVLVDVRPRRYVPAARQWS